MKRTVDILVASVLLLAVLPVLVVVLIGSVVTLRAWPLFTQIRVGRDGTPFQFLKVRTLPRSVPAYTDKYSLASFHVPRFCTIIRGLHLDELPQLFLVLTGKMTLVGPRPEMPGFHAKMNPDFAHRRTTVRPGCTGLWQVSVAQGRLIAEHPEFDEYYLSHRSWKLDAWVLWRTVLQAIPGLSPEPVHFDDLPPWAPRPSTGLATSNA